MIYVNENDYNTMSVIYELYQLSSRIFLFYTSLCDNKGVVGELNLPSDSIFELTNVFSCLDSPIEERLTL